MLKFMLRKTICVFVSASMVLSAFATITNRAYADTTSASNIQAEFFVSSNGSDSNPGTYEKPLATLDGARKAVETINEDMTGDIYVFFEPGKYYTPNTVNFTTADSGTNGHHVIYKTLGAPGSAKFVGGMKASSGWTQVQASTNSANPDSDMQQTLVGQVYKTNLQSQLNTIFPNGLPATSGPLPLNANGAFHVNTMYINDTRATQARTLNSNKYPGYPSTFFDNPLFTAGGNYINMTYKTSDTTNIYETKLVNAQARGDLSAQIVTNDIGGGHSWNSNTLPITSINTSSKTLTFNPNNVGDFSSLYTIGSNSRYYLQGNLAYLDTPGEFYFNPVTYDLFYYPKANETNLDQQDIIVPTTEQIINITGQRTGTWDSTVITPVHNIVFDGLELKDTTYPDYYAAGWSWLQYGNGVKQYPFPDDAKISSNPTYSGQSERPQFMDGVFTLKYADHITITNTHIKNAGMMGIELGYGTSYITVSNSLIEYTGHAGVDIQGGYPGVDGTSQGVSFTHHNIIDNSVIHDIGQLNLLSHAVGISNATYNTVTHIEAYNSPRRAFLLQSSNVQGWDNGYLGDGYTNQAFPYNLQRDQYAHHNTFSYINLHNVQQDGGDDGGIMTAFLYYPRDNYSLPNYFNQVVIDKVAAIPTMTDITPNNINFDMGWVGIETSNIKTVNAAQYNIENSNLQNGQVIVNNSSFNFRGPEDGLAAFDNSQMDFANIGVKTSRYPAEYAGAIADTAITPPSNPYFSDNFENGLDWRKWSYSGVLPTLSKEYMSEGPFLGTAALNLDDSGTTKSILYRNFSNNLNKVVTVDFFDRVSSHLATYGVGHPLSAITNTSARVDNGTAAGTVEMGVNTGVNGTNYVVNVGGTTTATSLRRTTGWHTLKFDYTDPTSVKLYIDNNLVKNINGTGQSFNYVALGSPDGNTNSFFDQLYIYGGNEAPAPGDISFPAPPPYDNSNDNIQQVNWDFENGVMPSGFTNFYGGTLSVVNNPLLSGSDMSSKVLYQGPGVAQFSKQTWSNYMLAFKWKLGAWNNSSDTAHVYDGFTVYVGTQQTATTAANPAAYQVIFRRNLNGGINANYPAGTPFFAINQHSPGDVMLATAPVPAGFDPTKWHQFQIQVFGGKIGLVVDGTKVISYSSSAYTSGSFGLGTYNNDQYFDDFQIITNPKYVNYAPNLNLGNAVLNGSFNPNYTTYMATVTNPAQPVTLIRPKVVLDNTSVAIKLNGTDITSNFTDDATPVSLNLIKGKNTLVLTQTTVAGSQDYTIDIDKPYTISSIAPIAPVTINVGSTPTLPLTTSVTFDDSTQQTLGINWHTIDPSLLNTPGTFTVYGQLDDVNGTVSTTVTVDGLKEIGTLPDVTTVAGTAPVLAQTVSAQFTNESKDLSLSFVDLDPEMYAKPGTFIAVANAEQYAGVVLQKVTVLPAPVSPQATLTSGHQVMTGEALDLTMGLSNVTQSEFQLINAQELTLTYDAVKMQLGTVTSLVYGLQVIDQKETVPGHVRIILASTDPDGFVPQGDLLKFSFTATAVTEVTNTAFDISNFTIANGLGNEMHINGASSSTQIILPAVPVDKLVLNDLIASAQAKYDAAVEGNMDGKYLQGSKAILQSAIDNASATANDPNATQVQVNNAKAALEEAVQAFEDKKISADVSGNGIISIGDLAMASSSYGKQPGQSGWNAKADVNKDGKVDIIDLAIVAKTIIN